MLRVAMGFDHVKARNVQETWIATCGYGIARKFAVANKGLTIDDEGYLTCPAGNAAGNNVQPYFNIGQWLEPSGYNKLWVGFLLKVYTAGNNSAFLYITSDAAGVSFLTVLSYAELITASGVAAAAIAGYNPYIELEIDLAESTVTVWIDSVVFKTVALTGASKTLLASGKFWLALNLTNTSTSGLIGVKDLLAGDDIAGDGMVAHLGPRKLYPIVIDEATGSNWTSTSGGSLLDTLNVAPETSPAGVVSNVGPTGNLECSLKAPTLPTTDTNVSGIFLLAALQGTTGSVQTQLSLKSGALQSPALTKNLSPTLAYNYSFGSFPTALDGTKWTPSKIDATKVVVTPDA